MSPWINTPRGRTNGRRGKRLLRSTDPLAEKPGVIEAQPGELRSRPGRPEGLNLRQIEACRGRELVELPDDACDIPDRRIRRPRCDRHQKVTAQPSTSAGCSTSTARVAGYCSASSQRGDANLHCRSGERD
ncbi:hypothetical protein HBB16_14085 [Pseudonocardia sp. MCCB 268]|nr:hypothetical protein [Pseudonocardia cytotoxica]